MAEYRVNIANRIYDVSIEDNVLEVNGDRLSYNMETLNGNGLHILRQPHRTVETYLETNRGGSYEIQIEGKHLSAEVALGFQEPKKAPAAETGNVVAPMPGVIINVLVKSGDQVSKGDTLVVQEAMKMQMKLRALEAGVVNQIYTSPGSQVDKGNLLLSINPV
jgi:biotin carboxyl carrier protein